MGLPKRLEKLVAKIATQTEVEAQLLSSLTKRLSNNLVVLNRHFGTDCEDCFEYAIRCAIKEQSKDCLDLYEECVVAAANGNLNRVLTEAELMMAEELADQVAGIAEILLTMGGVTLIEEEDPEEEVPPQPMAWQMPTRPQPTEALPAAAAPETAEAPEPEAAAQ